MRHALAAHLKGNAVAYLALFIALGGTSYAAVKLPAASVGSAQLKKGAVTEAKLSPSVLAKLNRAGVPGPAGAAGAVGPAGPKGDPGADGVLATGSMDDRSSRPIPATGIINGGFLTSVSPATGGGDLRIDRPARLVISGTIGMSRVGTTPAAAFCNAVAVPDTTRLGTQVGGGADAVLDGSVAGGKVEVPIQGVIDVAPGGWNVTIACSRIDGTRPGDIVINSVDMTVIAIAR